MKRQFIGVGRTLGTRKDRQEQSVSLVLWDAQLIPPDDDRTVGGRRIRDQQFR
jgi:hypothetical protein